MAVNLAASLETRAQVKPDPLHVFFLICSLQQQSFPWPDNYNSDGFSQNGAIHSFTLKHPSKNSTPMLHKERRRVEQKSFCIWRKNKKRREKKIRMTRICRNSPLNIDAFASTTSWGLLGNLVVFGNCLLSLFGLTKNVTPTKHTTSRWKH